MAPGKKVGSASAKKAIVYLNTRYDAAQDRANNTVGIRLAQARSKAGLTLDAFSKLLLDYGVAVKRGSINRWENGESLPNVYQLIAICKALDIEEGLSYFMGERVARQPLNELGMKKVAEYKADLIASGRYKPASRVTENAVRYITMPVSILSASAGTGEFLDDENFTEEQFPEDFVPDGADFGIHVCGDSMEPVYHDGQIVWVRQCERLEPGEVGIFLYDGDGYIKLYNEQEPDEDVREFFGDSYGNVHMQPVLISYNRKYRPILVSPHSRFQIVGRVL